MTVLSREVLRVDSGPNIPRLHLRSSVRRYFTRCRRRLSKRTIAATEKLVWPFLFIYGFSYFFTEFGPNATTFVYPSGIFPVKVRTTAHGIAAALGKIGGFVGVFTFPFFMHWHGLPAAEGAAAVVSGLGLLLTIVMLPETKGKSLEELSEEPSSPAEKAAA